MPLPTENTCQPALVRGFPNSITIANKTPMIYKGEQAARLLPSASLSSCLFLCRLSSPETDHPALRLMKMQRLWMYRCSAIPGAFISEEERPHNRGTSGPSWPIRLLEHLAPSPSPSFLSSAEEKMQERSQLRGGASGTCCSSVSLVRLPIHLHSPVLLCTPASNLRDLHPHPPVVTRAPGSTAGGFDRKVPKTEEEEAIGDD
ncbi:unnamed protein product [Pleuronectes platessa]|uniref:Uncharacterized protein n=1 Tax=Pleuronectes platessa TaxID=8262 RepID=A0A9N7YKU9_PLEPL|nr:unnamed protein product [Pleuronectes platessa]